MRTRKKIWFLYSLIPIVIAIVVGIGIYTRAFGMFSPKEPYVKGEPDSIALEDRKSTRLNSSHTTVSRMPSSA